MSRREHTSSQSYIDWLKSLGCVLWLPFAEDGDLNDRISGNDLQRGSDTTGYFAWDNSQEMMYFHSPSSYQKKSYTLQTNWNNVTFTSNNYTILSTFKKRSGSNYAFFFMVGSGYNIPNGAILNWNGTGRMSTWPSTLLKTAFYVAPDKRVLYQNGVFYNQYAAYPIQLPWNWGSYDYFVGTCDSQTGDSRNLECYVKDIMMFNRELTLSEIRQIQGFE